MSTEDLRILDRSIPLGASKQIDLELAKLHTSTPIKVPIIIERAKKAGPTVLLMGGVHGDEVNGVAIVREVIKKGLNRPKRGTIVCIPVFNVFGFLIQTREFPDGRDLNRMFPGSATGSLASQFAHAFRSGIAPALDYAIDFHTGGADRDNWPQVRCSFDEVQALELAKVFDAPFVVNSKHVSKSIRESLYKMGKTTLLFEGGRSNNLDPNVIAAGVKGATNVLRKLDMLDGPVEEGERIIINSSKWVRAPYSGMFYSKVENGAAVEKKTVIGKITDPYGKFERQIKAPFDCHIICVNTSAVVNKGDALYHVGESI